MDGSQMDGSQMDGEKSALLSSLNNQREHVLGILDGLSEDELRRAVLPSGWTCLGMVSHLAISVEQFWFRGVVAGEPIELMEDSAAMWQVDPGTRGDAVFEIYSAGDRARERHNRRHSTGRGASRVAREDVARALAHRCAGDPSSRDHRDGMSRRSPRRGSRAHRRPHLDGLGDVRRAPASHTRPSPQ